MLASSLCSNGMRIKLANIWLGSCQSFSTRVALGRTSREILARDVAGLGVRKPSPCQPRASWASVPGCSRGYAAIAARQPKLKASTPPFTLPPKPSPLLNPLPQAIPAESAPLPVLSPPSVGRWLLVSSALVFAVVVVGGVTRLTESGLSITEWRPITGILPPLSTEEWNVEFDKYKATPEFKL